MLPALLCPLWGPIIFPWIGTFMCGEHQSQSQGCRSSWESKKRLQNVPAKSQQPLKHPLSVLCQCCHLPVSARDMRTDGKKCLGPALNFRQDGICATLLENHLGIQMHGLFPSLLHLKGASFTLLFPLLFYTSQEEPGGFLLPSSDWQ